MTKGVIVYIYIYIYICIYVCNLQKRKVEVRKYDRIMRWSQGYKWRSRASINKICIVFVFEISSIVIQQIKVFKLFKIKSNDFINLFLIVC